MPADSKTKTTILKLYRQWRKREKSVFITAYDYPQAYLADQAGVDGILVGDSAAMTTHGHKTTIPITMEEMLVHCRAVNRGAKNAFKIGDMPYMSYQISNEEAVRNAGEFIKTGMDCVKVEGNMTDRIKAIADAGIIVMSHLGLTPHTRAKLGGYRVQGKTKQDVDKLKTQALQMQDAGCQFILLEAVPTEVGKFIQDNVEIPIYGIGAGDNVAGQLVIMHDLIGLFFEFKSKFVKRYLEGGKLIKEAIESYAAEVKDGQFPSAEHFYQMRQEDMEALMASPKWKYDEARPSDAD